MPRSVTLKTVEKTRAGATPQTADLTPNTPLVEDRNPYWPKSQNAFNEFPIVFQSNRGDITGATVGNPGTTYHIYKADADGGNVVALTGPLSSTNLGGTASQTEPATNGSASAVVYVQTDAAGAQDLVELNLNTGTSHSLLTGNTTFSFTALSHPEYAVVSGGNIGVIFAGKATGVTGGFHIFAVDTASGQLVQMTGGICDDKNPTLGPDSGKPVIAFDSDRGDPTGASVKGNRDIWVIDGNHALTPAVRVTNFAAGGQNAENIEPSWSSNKIDQPTGTQHIVNGQQLLGFSTNRYDAANDGNANGINPNGSHDLYWLKINIAQDPNNPANYTVVNPVNPANPPEAASNKAHKLTTSDPNHIYDDRHPTWPQFITSYRIAYHSDRTFYNAGSGQSGPAGKPADLFSSTLIDLNSPTLVRFDDATGEVLSVVPRIAAPGATVKISVKLQDLETGIRDVWVQIKNPNSKYQSSDNLEHKVFVFALLSPDGANLAVDSPVEYDSEPIFVGPYDANGNPTDSRFNTYPRSNPNRSHAPIYTASISDFFAFSGMAHDPVSASPPGPNHDPTKDTGWLKLTFDPNLSDPNTGVSVYSANWQTDNHPADYYIDVIAYDNALNPFSASPASAGVNWTIYDNVWGFSTQTFNPAHNVLFVSDYAPGQKFFGSRFGVNTLTNVFNTFWGTESWLLDIDPSLFPTAYVPKAGGTGGLVFDVRNTLGVDSYIDALNDDGTRIGGFPLGATQQYDLWRILSRGPVPDNILAQYVPRMGQQPPDKTNGETNPRNVLIASRCVIWHAPFTGDVFTGPGSLTDLSVQTQLHNYLAAGGRLMVNGQDIGWALTLDGASSNSFFSSDLKAQYVSDAEPNELFRVPTIVLAPIYLPSLDTSYQLAGKPAFDPITHDPWLILNAYLTLTSHIYLGPPFPPGTIDWIDRDANFVSGGTIPGAPGTIRTYESPAVAFPDNIRPGPGAISDMTYANGNSAVIRAQDGTTNSRVIYVAMGLEGLAADAYTPPGGGAVIFFKNRQMELMHNAICWMRTGSIVGKVVDTNGGGALANTLVRLSNKLDANGKKIIAYTGLTDSTGAFEIDGVEPTTYEITAVLPGFTIQKPTFVTTHGGFRDDISFKMTGASPATISGKVTRPDGTTPVVGATVVATDNLIPTAKFQAVTQADGTYTIKQVPSQTTYTLTVTAPGFGASIPVSYPVPNPNDPIAGQRDTLVQPAKAYVGFDFKLKPIPGNITGLVRDRISQVGIANAVVTATLGSTSFTAITDVNGNYTISGLDPGDWGLVATAPGYAPNVPVSVTVITNQTVTAPIIDLDRVAPGSISGLITRTSDGSPLDGVSVELKDQTGAIVGTQLTGPVQTGTGGYKFNYKFDTVPAGVTYTVTPTKSGYTAVPLSKQAAVTAGTETQNINFQMDPLHTFPGQLTMVSAPYDYPGIDIGDLLSVPVADRDGTIFRLATWEFGGYVFYPQSPANNFRLGRGYFMSYKNNLPLAVLGTAANPTQPFSLNLNPGWNIIGDPFLIDIDWTKVKVVSGATIYAHDQAVAAGLIGPALYSYVAGGYILDFKLSPWKGYWVRAFNNVTLQIDPLTDQYPGSRSAALKGGNSRAVLNGGDGWSVNLRLNVGQLRDEENYLGVSSRAVDGYDGFKAQKPPMFGTRFANLAFQHQNWGDKSGEYGVDVRSASANTKTWEFTAQTSEANATAILTWPNATTVNKKTMLVLTDLTTGTTRDMRTSGSYSWSTGEQAATRMFRIEAVPATKSGQLVVSDISARQTNRSASGGTTVNISYNLSAAADVEIRILGSTGAAVRKLSGRATRASGVNQAVWDQKNDQGVLMPAGVYMVEVRAQSGTSGQSVKATAPLLMVR